MQYHEIAHARVHPSNSKWRTRTKSAGPKAGTAWLWIAVMHRPSPEMHIFLIALLQDKEYIRK